MTSSGSTVPPRRSSGSWPAGWGRESSGRSLLGSALTGPLDERVRDQIVAEAAGNPLALLELPRGLTRPELAGGFGPPGGGGRGARVEEGLRGRAVGPVT